ncbi:MULTISPECIES: IctB family putative bicarbonate transporter [Cyanophyceae]|uniref:IctB family putative bicarbonate transporter n=1 Tax=Cyanophyceae TaxID=3028117 RepID=UPI001682A367|nr:IctB family putative bicarbonate transporter [Trichocoleus sp. FACHB-69]MBD1934816.1 putative bicarbonate transporter, IctB family [Trichocoleus sp. FACHB-69]
MTKYITVWQRFTMSNLPLYQWQSTSYLHRLVGILRSWRQSSWLMQWEQAIGAVLVALVFVLAPFVSNVLIGVLMAAGAGFWALLTLSDDRGYVQGSPKVTPIHWLVLLYWGIATIATALSPEKEAAFKGWSKLTLYLLFFALMARVLRSPRLRSILITVYLHVALIVSVYGLRQWFFGAEALATWTDPTSPMSKTTRVYSYLGNPNLLAAYLLPAIALSLAAVFVWRGWVPKALALTMFVVNSVCLVLTFSRGGWIALIFLLGAFGMMVVFWWSIQMSPFWRTWSLPLLLGSSAVVLLLALLFVEPLRDRVFSMFSGRKDSSNNFRLNVWSAVKEMIRDYPILGIGPGNVVFNKIYPVYQLPRYNALSAYSIFLELLVETGFIGFTSFMWLLIVTFNQGWLQLTRLREVQRRDGFWLMAAIAAMLGLLGHGLVDTVWYRPEVNTLWWMMVALIASYYVVSPASDRTLPMS